MLPILLVVTGHCALSAGSLAIRVPPTRTAKRIQLWLNMEVWLSGVSTKNSKERLKLAMIVIGA